MNEREAKPQAALPVSKDNGRFLEMSSTYISIGPSVYHCLGCLSRIDESPFSPTQEAS